MRNAIFTFTFLLAACGGGSSDDGPKAPTPPPDMQAPPPPASTPPRTMGAARAMQTPAENLLYDPTFSSLGNGLAFDLYGDGGHAEVPATSPAGPGSTVLVVEGSTTGQYYILGQGGSGPFTARVWISTSTKEASPVPVYFASMQDQNAVFQMDPVAGSTQKHGSLSYQLYEAKVSDPVYGSIAMVIDVSTTAKYTIAAPELVSATGMTTMSASRSARRVSLSASARKTIDALASRPVFPGTTGETRRVPMKLGFASVVR